MARPLRLNVPGGFYHVTSRGNERREICSEDAEREKFLGYLWEWTTRYRLRLHAYVLMTNHYHLLVETEEGNLSGAMQWLNTSYAQWYNRRHHRAGHLLQGRFKGILLDWPRWGLEVSRYLHLNPVRVARLGLGKERRRQAGRGTVREASAQGVSQRLHCLNGYRWSSYGAYVGSRERPEWLSCQNLWRRMGGSRAQAARAYRQYVEQGVGEDVGLEIWQNLKGQLVLGDEAFVNEIQEWLEGDRREQPGLRALRPRPGWEEVVRAVEAVKGEAWEEFRDRQGDRSRDVVLWLARRYAGLKLAELGVRAGGLDYRSVGSALRYLQEAQKQNAGLRRFMSQAEKLVKNKEI
ncbi:MAG TPA: transposase [Terriglobia bacterium]|nr:transposase [Terriglobia bacterium]